MEETSTDPAAQVTVVVATRDRREELVRHLGRHTAPVIVVDNGSTDGSVAAVRAAHPQVRVLALGRNLGAAARTIGVQLADTPYVAFADDDSWWEPGALEHAVSIFSARPRLAVIAGAILVGPEERPDPLNAVLASSPLGTPPDGPGPALLGFVACGAIVRRSAFLAVGGFDDVVRFPGEEERVALDLFDAGWQLCHVPAVRAHHHPSPRRDAPDARRAALTRSAVLTAIMRRPGSVVAAQTVAAVRAGAPGRRGLFRALPDVPAALRRRRGVSPSTEAVLAALASGGEGD
ncbi:glycosyltransferase [Brachybacterium huguangmaarense]|uniref:Glycosyltransferase n=1 Tax=Brachybacterium huguangmaarense TaxID=1652028 RepID=A0ABY6G4V4_9MICO|nr:glycosyltransferase [Brachybacterium huguangmaarense]UYG18258.1 glycosyltransferase [Brachybacterium huguangmaarense]